MSKSFRASFTFDDLLPLHAVSMETAIAPTSATARTFLNSFILFILLVCCYNSLHSRRPRPAGVLVLSLPPPPLLIVKIKISQISFPEIAFF